MLIQLRAVTWLFLIVGGASVVLAGVGLAAEGRADLSLFGVLGIPIGLGLRARRDLWRIVGLGWAFLVLALVIFGMLMLLGSVPVEIAFVTESGEPASDGAVAGVLAVPLVVSVWIAWILTRPRVLRWFGNAV